MLTIPYLKWELSEETNIGISALLFNNRLSVEADYYIRDTKDAAMYVEFPLIPGGVTRNLAQIRNTGFELALGWSDKIGKDFSYSIGGNISTLKNRVRDIYTMSYITHQNDQRSAVGHPIQSFYGYKVIGVYQTQEEIDNDPIAVANKLVMGDLRYEDRDRDRNDVLDGDDRTYLGSHLPNLMYGANIDLEYKDFELSVRLYGQSGNKVLNMRRKEIQLTPHLNVDADLIKKAWNGPGTSNRNPAVARLRESWNQKEGGFYVENASFLRIQNIQVAYNIRNKKVASYKLPDVRVSLMADRPFTFHSYNGFNPEVSGGLDNNPYPIPSVYTLGLSIKF